MTGLNTGVRSYNE